MPVWEISGAEFSKAEVHTANGISIRFPRVTKIRNDKDWKTATSLTELQRLYKTSKETHNLNIFSNLNPKNNTSSDSGSVQSSPSKQITLKRTLDSYVQHSKDKDNIETPVKKIKLSEGPQQRLPDLFSGICVAVPKSTSQKQFLRYFIAYGGTVFSSLDKHSPTHIIVSKKSPTESESESLSVKSSSIAVRAQWFWDSIRKGSLIPVENYQ